MSTIIDMHAHYVSRELVDEAGRNGAFYGVDLIHNAEGREQLRLDGKVTLRPFFPELCDLALRLPLLEASGVARQVLSTWTDLAGDLLPAREGMRWARLQNETLADAARRGAGKFEAMGTLPMQDVGSAIEELDHIVRNLGMRSVEIGTNVNGRDLDGPEFRPLWKRLREHDVFVFLHPPLVPVGLERTGAYFLNNLISYPVDTTIAAARLMFSGIFHELPGLKCCLAHAGGFLPFQIGRMDRGFAAHPACSKALNRRPSELMSSFYYDTLTHNDAALSHLVAVIDRGQILYGSDYPFEMLDPSGPSRVQNLSGLSQREMHAILSGNAERAFRSSPR
jgi:aminocarboxymuconate-semialdehyde decarboxylase